MIDLSATQHELLKEVVSAGPQGLRIEAAEASRRMGDLMFLALSDLLDVGPDRRVIATAKGRAFQARTAA